jgi:NAD(P)-dependent dehydrogenase (short-subunit alcohol dehydrogenase family)
MAYSKYAPLYLDPKGPGDARPTALEIIREHNRDGQLKGKVILITGCSSGLGIETARALATTGATLYLTARNLEKAKTAMSELLKGRYASQIHLLKLDLGSLESVRGAAAEFKRQSSRLDILIENAGIRHVPAGKTPEGFELQWGTNHLGHFLLFQLLKPILLSSSSPSFHSRVIAVSSQAHRQYPPDFSDLNWEHSSYDPVKAYSYSKLANVYMANEIERRYGSQGLHGWSLHPGGIRTGLQPAGLHAGFVSDILMVIRNGPMRAKVNLMNAEQGAATTVWAAVGTDLEGKGGSYLERCAIADEIKPGWNVDYDVLDPGHARWAYNETYAKQVWDMSLEMVQLPKDQ